MQVTVALINYKSPIIERLDEVVIPTLAHYHGADFEILVVDNEPEPNRELIEYLRECLVPFKYFWNEGQNLMVAASKNIIYEEAQYPYLVYICANHGRMYDPTWLEDMLKPFEVPEVAMTGTLTTYPLSHIDEGEGEGVFVQGGVLAARVEVMRRHPMSPLFPHYHSDKWIGFELQKHGYKLAHVKTVLSLWRQKAPEQHDYKYVHDEDFVESPLSGKDVPNSE